MQEMKFCKGSEIGNPNFRYFLRLFVAGKISHATVLIGGSETTISWMPTLAIKDDTH